MKYSLISLVILISLYSTLFSQNNKNLDPIEKRDIYKSFNERFHDLDQFIDKINSTKERNYYIVNYKKIWDKILPYSIAYYSKTTDELVNNNNSYITQQVNFEDLSYYYINYNYDKHHNLIEKSYKDINQNILAIYKYFWDNKSKKLIKLEKWAKTTYLDQMEMKSYNELIWKGNQLDQLLHYYPDQTLIEKYHFNKTPDNTALKEVQYLIGNNKISIQFLKKYERYRTSKPNFLAYYIEFVPKGKQIIQKIYSNDNLLYEINSSIYLP